MYTTCSDPLNGNLRSRLSNQQMTYSVRVQLQHKKKKYIFFHAQQPGLDNLIFTRSTCNFAKIGEEVFLFYTGQLHMNILTGK